MSKEKDMTARMLSDRMSIKSGLRRVVAWGYYYSGLYKTYHKGKIHILMYHRVLKDNDKDMTIMQPGMYVTESAFKNQIRFLTKHYQVISLMELLELWKKKEYDKGVRYCVITFDDGWRDNYLNAYPLLKKYEIPATIFLATSYIGTNRWFWPEKLSHLLVNKYQTLKELKNSQEYDGGDVISSILAIINGKKDSELKDQVNYIIEELKKFPEEAIDNALAMLYRSTDLSIPEGRMMLDWSEVEEMSSNGVSFGSHTCNHRLLTRVSLSEAKEEINKSTSLLKEKKLNYVPVFCYPNGDYNQEIQETVRDCGYEAAVSTKFGFEGENPDDYFGINRIGVHNDISSTIPLFSFHLSGLRYRL